MNQEQRPRLRGLDVLQTRRTCPRKGRIIDRLQNEMVISVPAFATRWPCYSPPRIWMFDKCSMKRTRCWPETRLQVSDQHLCGRDGRV